MKKMENIFTDFCLKVESSYWIAIFVSLIFFAILHFAVVEHSVFCRKYLG